MLRDQPRPDLTIYRSGVLLMPPRVFQPNSVTVLNRLLADVDMTLVPPDDYLAEASTIAVELAPRDTFKVEAVDAWTALQRLRAGVDDLRAATNLS